MAKIVTIQVKAIVKAVAKEPVKAITTKTVKVGAGDGV
jgi:hypothetical protein